MLRFVRKLTKRSVTTVENRSLIKLINEISKIYYDKIAKISDIEFSNEKTPLLILSELSQRDGLSQSELVRSTHMKGSTVSIAISKMEERGYIVKEDNNYDKRSVKIYLTKKGRELNDKIIDQLKSIESSIISGISPREARIVAFALETVLENCKRI